MEELAKINIPAIISQLAQLQSIIDRGFGETASYKLGITAEQFVQSLCTTLGYSCASTRCEPHAGDLIVNIDGMRILIEVKNYESQIPREQVNKFLYDIDIQRPNAAIFISLHSAITGVPSRLYQDGSIIYMNFADIAEAAHADLIDFIIKGLLEQYLSQTQIYQHSVICEFAAAQKQLRVLKDRILAERFDHVRKEMRNFEKIAQLIEKMNDIAAESGCIAPLAQYTQSEQAALGNLVHQTSVKTRRVRGKLQISIALADIPADTLGKLAADLSRKLIWIKDGAIVVPIEHSHVAHKICGFIDDSIKK